MADLLALEHELPLDQGRVYDRFEAVVLLSAPAEVILRGIEHRTTNDYGKGPGERDRILSEPRGRRAPASSDVPHELDARRPVDEIVDTLIAIGRGSDPR